MLRDDVNKRMETTYPNMSVMLSIQIYKYVNIKSRRGRRDNINNDESTWLSTFRIGESWWAQVEFWEYFRPLRPLRAKIIRKFPAFQAKQPKQQINTR